MTSTGAYPPGCTQQMVDEAQPGYWDDAYDDEPREDDCDHEEYEIDWEGRGQCYRCGHSWWASSEQVAAQEEHERKYQEWVEQQGRPWFRFKEWMVGQFASWREKWKRRNRKPVELDDEIPF